MSLWPCPLCDSFSSPRHFLTGDGREYWHCGGCQLVFVPPPFHISSAEEKKHYLKHENSLENEGYVRMFQNKIQILEQQCPHAKTVLDFGCGYEPVLKTLLVREGYRVTAYDPYFFPDAPWNQTYDLIVSTETFEHFKAPGKELERLLACLCPGGWLAVMTRWVPTESGRVAAEAFSKWYYKRDPTHIAFYSADTFRWIARTFALKIIFEDGKDFILLQKKTAPEKQKH